MKRAKRRYLALRVEGEAIPSERELMDAIWGAVTKLYGEVGASQTGLALISFDVEKRILVIRTSLVALPCVRASLATITSVAGKDAVLRVLGVSGTLKSLFVALR
ncbi:MAG: Rpp14/Pop5 family protein [Candidatus Bathyarchaeota archaeon]|nr:Rpp14/Pop5 family protein [Candidatus Bathyarchaeota archaeon]